MPQKSQKVISIIVAALVTVVGLCILFVPNGGSGSVAPDGAGTPGSTTNVGVTVDPSSKENIQEVEVAISRFEAATSMIPGDAFLVSHANLKTAKQGDSWWGFYKDLALPYDGLLPATIDGKHGISAITFAAYPSASPVASEYLPVSKMLILATDASNVDELYTEMSTLTNGELYVGQGYVGNNGFVIIGSADEWEGLDKYIQSSIFIDSGEKLLPAELDRFSSREEKGNFSVNSESPALYLSADNYLSTLLPEGKLKDQDKKFWELVTGTGMGLQDNTAWLGKSDDLGKTWQGKFLTGGVDIDKIDTNLVKDEVFNQYKLESMSGLTQEELGEKYGSETGGVMDFGYVSSGLAATIDHAISVSKGDRVVGSILNPRDTQQREQAEVKNDGKVRIVISPGTLAATTGHSSPPMKLNTVTLTVGSEETSVLTFQWHKEK